MDINQLILNRLDLGFIQENRRMVGFVSLSDYDYLLARELNIFQRITVVDHLTIIDEIHLLQRNLCHFLKPLLDLIDRGRVSQVQIKPLFRVAFRLHYYRDDGIRYYCSISHKVRRIRGDLDETSLLFD